MKKLIKLTLLSLFIFTLGCTKTIVVTNTVTEIVRDTVIVRDSVCPVSQCSKDHWGYLLITLDVDKNAKYYSDLSFRRDSFQGMWDHLANYTAEPKLYHLYRNIPSGSFSIRLYQYLYPIEKPYWWMGPTDGPYTRISRLATVMVTDCDTAKIEVPGGM